ncbi:MAG: hypothetical protein ACHQIM_08245 [Sphingobacteriales bacterium]
MKATIQNETAGFSKWVRKMGKDKRLLATHISLFTALFVQWQRNDFISPFPVTRKGLMGYSRIASIATYHKCIREPNGYGYIRYQPSYDPVRGSMVYWPDCPVP